MARAKGNCGALGCDRPHEALGWCAYHYQRLRSKPTCSIPGCAKPVLARGWCTLHYRRFRRHGSPLLTFQDPELQCTVEGCRQRRFNETLCRTHYDRSVRTGQPSFVLLSFAERFWAKVDPEGPSQPEVEGACWIWLGSSKSHGLARLEMNAVSRKQPIP